MQIMTAWRQRRTGIIRSASTGLAASAFMGLAMLAQTGPAAALSEIGREELPPIAPSIAPSDDVAPPPGIVPGVSDETDEQRSRIAHPEVGDNGPLPEVVYDLDRLPEPVRRMRERIVEAAKSGDIEQLRPLLGLGDDTTIVSFGDPEGDPLETLKGQSGDPEGQEILAILEEVLEAGFVHLEPGTPNELYVWPYFFGLPLDKLDARQRVELFKIVTAGDLEDMKQFGAYIFYRSGITPEGRWAFFVAGE